MIYFFSLFTGLIFFFFINPPFLYLHEIKKKNPKKHTK